MAEPNEEPQREATEGGEAPEASDAEDVQRSEDERVEQAAGLDDADEEPQREATDGGEASERDDAAPADDASAGRAKDASRSAEPRGAAARLAARRAAKRALKEARRRTDPEEIEDEAEEVAREATRWATDHRSSLLMAVVGLVVVLGGAVAWSNWRDAQAAERAGTLWQPVSAASAPIVPEGSPPPLGVDETYASVRARAEAAAKRFAEAAGKLDGVHAGWARLGEGAARLQLGDPTAARKAFEAAKRSSEGEARIEAGALEGLGQVAEAEEKWNEAVASYEQLGKVARGRYRPLAELGLARVEAARGEKEAAIGRLKKLVGRLGDGPRPDGEESYGQLPYVQNRAEALLRELDPSYAPVTAGAGAGGGQISPEQLQRLLEQLRRQQGAGGGQ